MVDKKTRSRRTPAPAPAAPPARLPEAVAEGAPEPLPAEVAALAFEEALTPLEHIVDELEEGALPLEEALARFERGIHLSRHLERQLGAAEARVRKLVGGEPGAPVLAPLGGEADEGPEDLEEEPAGEGDLDDEDGEDGGDEDDGGDRLF